MMRGRKDAGLSDEAMAVGGRRWMTVRADGVVTMMRGRSGAWIDLRLVPFRDIRAVYRYYRRDWTVLIVASLMALVVALFVGIFAATFAIGAVGTILSALGALVFIGGLGIARFAMAQLPMVRIHAYSGQMVLEERNPAFYVALAAGLAAALAAPSEDPMAMPPPEPPAMPAETSAGAALSGQSESIAPGNETEASAEATG